MICRNSRVMIIMAAALLLSAAQGSYAQESALTATPAVPPRNACQELRAGMAMREVISLLGAATEKVAFESSRKELWRYPSCEVWLRQGVVHLPAQPGRNTVIQTAGSIAQPAPAVFPAAVRSRRHRAATAAETAAVFKEIMQAIPSEPDGGALSSGSGPTAPGEIKPIIKPLGAYRDEPE